MNESYDYLDEYDRRVLEYTINHKVDIGKLCKIHDNDYFIFLKNNREFNCYIKKRITFKEISMYRNYQEFRDKVYIKLGNGSLLIGKSEFKKLSEKFENYIISNYKDEFLEEELHLYYEVIAIFNFYKGFLVEDIIKNEINKSKYLKLAKDEGIELDVYGGVDIQYYTIYDILKGLQVKPSTFLNQSLECKNKEINKHHQHPYFKKTNVFYFVIYNKQSLRIQYYSNNINKSYLLSDKDVQTYSSKNIKQGIMAEFLNQLIYNSEYIEEM